MTFTNEGNQAQYGSNNYNHTSWYYGTLTGQKKSNIVQ